MNATPRIYWITGLPAAGKTTLARALAARLSQDGLQTFVLDGDELRRGLCADLGLTDQDRTENIRRAGEVARLFVSAGITPICAFVSPFAADRQRVRRLFAGLDAFEDVMPDESTILRFRHLLEKRDLAVAIFAEVSAVLSEKGLSMKRGTVVDATLIAAPSSTKNEDKKRDPEMTQTKKGNQWHFGMKAHIGVDAESGLIHTVECTTAKVADITMMEACLHEGEEITLGDRGYHKTNRTIAHFTKEGDLSVLTPTRKPDGGELTEEQKAFNRMLSAVQAIVEHPFRIIKRQFGFVKVRYRGLTKNTGQIVTLFALANLWLARKRLLPLKDEVSP